MKNYFYLVLIFTAIPAFAKKPAQPPFAPGEIVVVSSNYSNCPAKIDGVFPNGNVAFHYIKADQIKCYSDDSSWAEPGNIARVLPDSPIPRGTRVIASYSDATCPAIYVGSFPNGKMAVHQSGEGRGCAKKINWVGKDEVALVLPNSPVKRGARIMVGQGYDTCPATYEGAFSNGKIAYHVTGEGKGCIEEYSWSRRDNVAFPPAPAKPAAAPPADDQQEGINSAL